ncbi:hypothetical protein ACNKHK_17165 [Shigella flexneri]
MRLYPWLTWRSSRLLSFVLVVMLFRPAQQLESYLYRVVSHRNYLYRANYGSLEKAGIVAKNTRS